MGRAVAVLNVIGEHRFRDASQQSESCLRTALIGRHVCGQLLQTQLTRKIEDM